MSIPILTYHAMNIDGPTADRNDLVGLSEDIEVLHGLGYRIRPLADIVRRWLHAPSSVEGCKEVALTCDDGSDFDFHDLPHPTWGVQRSVLNRLADAAAKLG